jgi:hypothetical protein
VQLLRDRIELLERVLRSRSIDVDVAIAQLQAADVDAMLLEANGGNDIADAQVEEVCTTFEGTLSLDESINFDQDGEAHYFGPTSGRLGFQARKLHTEPGHVALLHLLTICTVGDSSCDNYLFPKNGSQSMETNLEFLSCPKSQPPSILEVDADLQAELIDLYFMWQNPWFPILDERLFRESQKKGDLQYFNPLLLNCVLAAGSRFSDSHKIRTSPENANSAGGQFLSEAEILLHYDLKSPSLTTIQSVSILILVHCVS